MAEFRSPLHDLELRVEKEAREFHRQRMEEELAKLAAAESAALFPPQGNGLPADPRAERHVPVARRRRGR